MLGCCKESTKATHGSPCDRHVWPRRGWLWLWQVSGTGRALRSAEGSRGKSCPRGVVIPKGAEGLPGDRQKHSFSSLSSDSNSDFSAVGSWPPGPTQGAKLSSCCAPLQAGLGCGCYDLCTYVGATTAVGTGSISPPSRDRQDHLKD